MDISRILLKHVYIRLETEGIFWNEARTLGIMWNHTEYTECSGMSLNGTERREMIWKCMDHNGILWNDTE